MFLMRLHHADSTLGYTEQGGLHAVVEPDDRVCHDSSHWA